jgi:hypothetical protein
MRLQKKTYTSRREERKDMALGFGGIIVANVLLFLLISRLGNLAISSLSTFLLLLAVPILLNAAALVFFVLTRSRIALGMVIGFAAALVIAMVALPILCFTNMGSL